MKIAAMLNENMQVAAENLMKARIPATSAFKLKKIIDQINGELANYNALLSKIQARNTNAAGEVDQQAFLKDYQELVNIDIPMDKIPVSHLDNANVSVDDIIALEPILDGLEDAGKAVPVTASKLKEITDSELASLTKTPEVVDMAKKPRKSKSKT